MGTDERPVSDDLRQRFPQLNDVAGSDIPQRIETFQAILDQLQRELDETR
ncbi:hypothetical protein [Bifidobacterium aerophilum]|nr:hypothetical protein [Bifidobacterium aerophilum]